MTMIPTSDLGVIELPDYCPAWCEKQHVQYALENEDVPAEDATAHTTYGGHEYLREIRRPGAAPIDREAGDSWSSWSLVAHQYLQAPYTAASGYATPPLVEMLITKRGQGQQALTMTTGEARVLIAHLSALVDRVDLAR